MLGGVWGGGGWGAGGGGGGGGGGGWGGEGLHLPPTPTPPPPPPCHSSQQTNSPWVTGPGHMTQPRLQTSPVVSLDHPTSREPYHSLEPSGGMSSLVTQARTCARTLTPPHINTHTWESRGISAPSDFMQMRWITCHFYRVIIVQPYVPHSSGWRLHGWLPLPGSSGGGEHRALETTHTHKSAGMHTHMHADTGCIHRHAHTHQTLLF